MRRKDREIVDFQDIISVIEKCDVCRIALNDGDYPYIVPLNFGFEVNDGKIILYFHSAKEGKKLDLIKADSRTSFEMDCGHRLVITSPEKGYCTMEYESVMGRGKIEILPDEEKERALNILMNHYRKESFIFSRVALPRTEVFKLTVEEITGKAKR